MDKLVYLEKNKIVTTSLIIAEQTGNIHPGVFKLIKTHKQRLERSGVLGFEIRKPKTTGRPQKIAILNEEQTTLLLMLMGNNEKVMDFKELINTQFHEMRRALTQIHINQSNEEWKQLRTNSKVIRREETDVIKEFVEYATEQGSQNAKRYYANISKMENSALFFLNQKFTNIREILGYDQLFTIGVADQIIRKTLRDGMTNKLDYHEIYQIAKGKIESLAEDVGKTPLPMSDIKELTQ